VRASSRKAALQHLPHLQKNIFSVRYTHHTSWEHHTLKAFCGSPVHYVSSSDALTGMECLQRLCTAWKTHCGSERVLCTHWTLWCRSLVGYTCCYAFRYQYFSACRRGDAPGILRHLYQPACHMGACVAHGATWRRWALPQAALYYRACYLKAELVACFLPYNLSAETAAWFYHPWEVLLPATLWVFLRGDAGVVHSQNGGKEAGRLLQLHHCHRHAPSSCWHRRRNASPAASGSYLPSLGGMAFTLAKTSPAAS